MVLFHPDDQEPNEDMRECYGIQQQQNRVMTTQQAASMLIAYPAKLMALVFAAHWLPDA